MRSRSMVAVRSSSGLATSTVTRIAAAAPVTMREARCTRRSIASPATTMRPRRPWRWVSRADQAVTASRSRSSSASSGTSTASDGAKRAAIIDRKTSSVHETRASRPSKAGRRSTRRPSSRPRSTPCPPRRRRSTGRRPIAGDDGGRDAGGPGSWAAGRAPARERAANAAAAAKAGAAAARCARVTADGQRADERARRAATRRSTVRRRRRPRERRTAANTANRAATRAISAPARGLSGRVLRRLRAAVTWRGGGRRCVATSTSPESTPPSESGTSACERLAERGLKTAGCRTRPAWSAYSRATSMAVAPAGTRRSMDPSGPCTVSAMVALPPRWTSRRPDTASPFGARHAGQPVVHGPAIASDPYDDRHSYLVRLMGQALGDA